MVEGGIPAWFFPRGPGPLVSICMCSRHRVPHLVHAVDSLISLVKDPGNIEFIFKVDDDDLDTINIVTQIKQKIPQNVEIIITPRGRGYLEIGHWCNLMSDRARGDWILFFNDDARMLTQDWDFKLLSFAWLNCWHICPEDVMMLALETNGLPNSNEFPLIRRKTYELLGRRFDTPYVDSWMYEITNLVKSYVKVNAIKVEHLRETINDGIRKETDDCWAAGIGTLIGSSPIMGQLGDAARFLGHIDKTMIAARWHQRPFCPGWWYWRPAPIRSGIHVLVDVDKKIRASAATDIVGKIGDDINGMWYPRITSMGEEGKWW